MTFSTIYKEDLQTFCEECVNIDSPQQSSCQVFVVVVLFGLILYVPVNRAIFVMSVLNQ